MSAIVINGRSPARPSLPCYAVRCGYLRKRYSVFYRLPSGKLLCLVTSVRLVSAELIVEALNQP